MTYANVPTNLQAAALAGTCDSSPFIETANSNAFNSDVSTSTSETEIDSYLDCHEALWGFSESKFKSIQSTLRDLQGSGIDGAAELNKLAKQLSNALGTEVTPSISADNQFSVVWNS